MSNKNSIHGFNNIMGENEERIILLEDRSVEKKLRLKHRMKKKKGRVMSIVKSSRTGSPRN